MLFRTLCEYKQRVRLTWRSVVVTASSDRTLMVGELGK